jgi:hypothetical protein
MKKALIFVAAVFWAGACFGANIKMEPGETYDEISEKFGKPGKKIESFEFLENEITLYMWDNTLGVFLNGELVDRYKNPLIKLAASFYPKLLEGVKEAFSSPNNVFTCDQYKLLSIGMPADQVGKILPPPYVGKVFKAPDKDQVFLAGWKNEKKKEAIVLIFHDNKIATKLSKWDEKDIFKGKSKYDDIIDMFGKPDKKFRYVLEKGFLIKEKVEMLLCGWESRNFLVAFFENSFVGIGELDKFSMNKVSSSGAQNHEPNQAR